MVRGGWTEWRPLEEQKKSEALGASSQIKTEQAQRKEMFTELSTPKLHCICAAAARSDRSLCQLCSQLQQVCCGASCKRRSTCAALHQTDHIHPTWPLFFDSSPVEFAHNKTCREMGKQSKKNALRIFFPKAKRRPCAQFNPIHLGSLLHGRRRKY